MARAWELLVATGPQGRGVWKPRASGRNPPSTPKEATERSAKSATHPGYCAATAVIHDSHEYLFAPWQNSEKGALGIRTLAFFELHCMMVGSQFSSGWIVVA